MSDVQKKASGCILSFDVSNREEAEKILSSDIKHHDPHYGIICNAGITNFIPFRALTGQQLDDLININLNSFFNVLNPVIEPMISENIRSRIIAISSISGVIGSFGQTNYSAAKSLALEVARHGITVNCIAPGYIETDMLNRIDMAVETKKMLMKREGKANEIASLAAYLLSRMLHILQGRLLVLMATYFLKK